MKSYALLANTFPLENGTANAGRRDLDGVLLASLIGHRDLPATVVPVVVVRALFLDENLDVGGGGVDEEEVVGDVLDDPGRDEGALEMGHFVMCPVLIN